jgi:hypothetical protein
MGIDSHLSTCVDTQSPKYLEMAQGHISLSSVSCVSSIVLMGRETGSLQLLAPLLLTGGKGADLVIRGNVVLNTRHPGEENWC